MEKKKQQNRRKKKLLSRLDQMAYDFYMYITIRNIQKVYMLCLMCNDSKNKDNSIVSLWIEQCV